MSFLPRPGPAMNKVVTIPAPVGGLNARDSLVSMPETDAIVMNNLWPQPYGVSVRKGYAEYAIGMSGEVGSLATWASLTGTKKMFAWATTNMYDISGSGSVSAPIVTGLSSYYWQTTAMSNAAGSHLIAVTGNSLDDAILYNAGGVARLVAGNGITVNTWNQLNPRNASQVTVHQGRLWAVEKDTSRGWYLPVGAIYGVFVSYDFGPLFSRGGYLQYLFTWTLDDGNGAEDHLVAVSSQGEVVAYAGTNPSSSTTWALVGVYFAGVPVAGLRSFTKLGGDMAMITQRGVVSLTNLLASTKVNQEQSIIKSSKIQYLISQATTDFGVQSGWQLIYVATYNMLILNIPSTVVDGNFQFVANEVMPTEPWTQFTGMDAAVWIVHDNLLYYGDYTGRVCQAWTGTADNVRIAAAIATNPDFTANITGWAPNGFATNAWVAGVNRVVKVGGTTNYAQTLQTAGVSYLGQTLRLTATYRNVTAVGGANVRVTDGVSLVLATLPTNLTTSYVTNSIDFVCTTPSFPRIEGQTAANNESAGVIVEFESINLTVAPVGTQLKVACQQAYTYLGALSIQKQVGMYRANFVAAETFSYSSSIAYDFAVITVGADTTPLAQSTSGVWNTSNWNVGLWGGGLQTNRLWNQANGLGVAASLLIQAQISGEVVWVSTDYSYKLGTLL